MKNLILMPFLFASFFDAPIPWQLGFQDPATPIIIGITHIHNHLIYFLVVIIVWSLAKHLLIFSCLTLALILKKNKKNVIFLKDLLFEATIDLYIFICFGFWYILFGWCLNKIKNIKTYFWLLINDPRLFLFRLYWWGCSGGLLRLLSEFRLIIVCLNVLLNIFVGLGPIFILGPDVLLPDDTDMKIRCVLWSIKNLREGYHSQPTETLLNDSLLGIHPLTISVRSACEDGDEVVTIPRNNMLAIRTLIDAVVDNSEDDVIVCDEGVVNRYGEGVAKINFPTEEFGRHNFPPRLLNGEFKSWQLNNDSLIFMKNCTIEDVRLSMSQTRIAYPIIEKDSFIILLPGGFTLVNGTNVVLEQHLYLENVGFIPLNNSSVYGYNGEDVIRFEYGDNKPFNIYCPVDTQQMGPNIATLQAHNETSLKQVLVDYVKKYLPRITSNRSL